MKNLLFLIAFLTNDISEKNVAKKLRDEQLMQTLDSLISQ